MLYEVITRGNLAAQEMPAIQKIEKLKPVSVNFPKVGLMVIDFGQNSSGWIRIKMHGTKGDSVVFRYAENIEDGMLNVATNQRAVVKDIYIFKGEKEEVYESRFTYHGYQYRITSYNVCYTKLLRSQSSTSKLLCRASCCGSSAS